MVTGTLTLDYAPDMNGTAEITLLVTDTGGLTVETSFMVTVLSASQHLDELLDEWEDLIETGVLAISDGPELSDFLTVAIMFLDEDNHHDLTEQAIMILEKIIIPGIVSLIDPGGPLSPEIGQSLIDDANAAITAAQSG